MLLLIFKLRTSGLKVAVVAAFLYSIYMIFLFILLSSISIIFYKNAGKIMSLIFYASVILFPIQKLQENNFSVDILVHSMSFWKEVQGGNKFLKKDDKDKDDDDDIWDDIIDWWKRHKVQIREVFVGACDSAGGVIGSCAGPAGTIAGAALGTAAGTTIWPPYSENEGTGGSDNEK